MPGTLTKLFLTATLLLSGGIASADSWRGPANPSPAPVPVQVDTRDHRGPGPDRFDRFDRDRRDAPPQARVEHDRPRRGFVWVSGQWERGPRGRWIYERVHRGGRF
jgi:hypothetical protein